MLHVCCTCRQKYRFMCGPMTDAIAWSITNSGSYNMAMSGGRRSTDETTIQFVQHHHRQQLLTPDIIDTVEWHCYSAPQSRSGSFKKPRRTGLLDAQGPRSSLPSLEDSISAKLLELQQLEADDCRVVREFVTSSRGGIVNRGDSFRRNRETEDETETTTTTKTDRQRHTDTRAAAQQVPAQKAACKVLIIGDRGVGKTSLLHQLMTSHYMAAMNTCSFGQWHSLPTQWRCASVCLSVCLSLITQMYC